MRKLHIVFFLTLLTKALQSQGYFKMLDKDTTTWQHFSCMIPVVYKNSGIASIGPSDHPIVAIDTITINSALYRKVYQLQAYSLNYANKLFFGYMREDTTARKVFFRETTAGPEYLLYDFSISLNDSIQLTFPNNSSDNGFYRVDSVITKTEKCGPRKHFFLRKHINNFQPAVKYIEYIESIGSTLHVLYPYSSSNIQDYCWFSYSTTSCRHYWPVGLACKHDNFSKRYQSCTYVLAQQNGCVTPVDSCNYRTTCSGIRSHELPQGVTVFPNPASDKLSVQFSDNLQHRVAIEISDISGKLFVEQDQKITGQSVVIDIRGLDRGYYLLRIKIDGSAFSQPLMIEP